MLKRSQTLFVVGSLVGGVLAAQTITAGVAGAAGAFAANDVVVYRVGTGAAALGSGATAAFLDEYTPTGTFVQSIALPTTASGANKALVESGSASSDGELALSADSRYLLATGYNAAVGTSSITGTTAASVSRTIGRIDASGNVNTTTSLTDAYSANNIRSAASADGTGFWVGGADSTSGVRYAALGASTSTPLTSGNLANARQVGISNGQLYTSASSSGFTLATVGSGLPATGTQPVTNLNFSPAPTAPYGYSLLTLGTGSAPDTLYVADNGAGKVVKYTLQGGTWTTKGSVTLSGVTGLTANDNNGTVTVFATTASGISKITDTSGLGGTLTGSPTTIATAGANTGFRGVALAPGTVIGSGGGTSPANPPTITAARSGLPAALGDPTNPTDSVTVADDSYPAAQLTVTASSSNQSVVKDGGVTVSGSGATRTVSVTPAGASGTSTITLTVKAPDGQTNTTQILYGVSADLSSYGTRYYTGAGNASAAIDVGDGYFIAADDENNTLRLYQKGQSGPPANTFSFPDVGTTEADLEGAARNGNVIYWAGSLSNTSGGNLAPSRDIIFATRVSGSGANTTLTYLGKYTNVKEDLAAWDHANGDVLGLTASAAAGVDGHSSNALNLEGIEFAPDGSLYLGLRAPLEPTSNRHLALLVPLTNAPALTGVSGSASQATFGDAVELDLGGLAVRDIRKNADGQYLIIAGSADDSNGSFQLYTWDGNPAHAARPTGSPLPTLPASGNSGSWETIISVPDPLSTGVTIPLLQDDGTVDWYGTGQTTKTGLPADLQKSLGVDQTYTAPAAQPTTTTLGVDKPSPTAGQQVTYTATVGADPSVTGTPSGTVSFADGGSVINGCGQQPLSGGTATCTITYPTSGDHSVIATYSGDSDFAASPSGSLALSVGKAGSSVTLTVSDGPYVVGADLTITATVAAPNSLTPSGAVEFTDNGNDIAGCAAVDASSGTATCTIDGGLPAGDHQLGATYSGDAAIDTGSAAPQSITVDPAQQLSWGEPADITYGDALTATQLDAQSTVDGSFSYALSDGTPVDVGTSLPAGTYTLVATFTPADPDEYSTDTVSTALTVDQAPLTIVADTQGSSTYGSDGPTVKPTYVGFVNGDGPSSLTTAPTCSTGVGPSTPAGSYMDAATCSGANAANYTIAYADDAVVVAPAPLRITATGTKRVYGRTTPAFGLTYHGFVNGQDAADLDGTPTYTATPVGGGTPVQPAAGTPAGKYLLTPAGLTSSNYTISYQSGLLTIVPAKLVVTPNNATRSYGGADPAFSVRYSGFVAGDGPADLGGTPTFSATRNGTPSAPNSPVGSYVLRAGGLTSPNYTIAYGTGKLIVNPAVLTVTVTDASRVQGDPNPPFSVTYAGFVLDDDASVVQGTPRFATHASPNSKPGRYLVQVSGLTASNYKLTYVPGTLTVTRAGG